MNPKSLAIKNDYPGPVIVKKEMGLVELLQSGELNLRLKETIMARRKAEGKEAEITTEPDSEIRYEVK